MIKIKFAISSIEFWKNHGFDTTEWRKSIDGTQAIVHLGYAETLIPGIEQDSNVQIYSYPSQELTDLLNSPIWTSEEGV